MSLLTKIHLREVITQISCGNNVSCAVAFWGKGAGDLFGPSKGRTIRIVCNLKMGGTNPDVIETIVKTGATVLQNDRLHAKVYIGDKSAVVTSANASINGLGLEGDELAGWIEVGVEVPAQDVLPWFERIWKESRPISPEDIENARRLFRERAITKPTRGTFENFCPTEKEFPLVGWVTNSNYKYNDDQIERAIGRVNDTVYEQIDNGIDIEADEDVNLFRRGLWVLYWMARADGTPGPKSEIWWTCSSGIHVPNGFTYEGRKPQGVILSMHPMPPEPFDASEPRFRKAFREVMSLGKFSCLRDQNYEGSFYTAERLESTRQFWEDMKKYYDSFAE